MQVNITFRGMESTDSLKAYVNEKIGHLGKYFDRPLESHTVLSLERYLHQADIGIQAGSYLLRGKSRSEDMYRSIDDAVDKIEKQVKRYKDKLRTLKQRGSKDEKSIKWRHAVFEANPEIEEGEEWTQGPKIIRSNEFVVNSMSVDEAVMQMDLMNNQFLVFTNVETNDINVIYRRTDGHFGLIEAARVLKSG